MNKGFKIRKNNTSGELTTRYNQSIQDELDKYPSVITIPVQWGQQDTNNHLNNCNFLRFVESSRVDYISILSLYMEPKKFFELVGGKEKGLIVKNINIKYISQVTYPDSLTIATKVKDITSNSCIFYSKLYSLANDKIAAESEVLMVSYDFKAGKKSGLDPSLVEAITKMEDDPKSAQEDALCLPTRTNSNL